MAILSSIVVWNIPFNSRSPNLLNFSCNNEFFHLLEKKKITKIESKNLSIFYNLLSVSNSTPNISLILTISQTCYLTLPIQKKKGRNKVLFKKERERTYRSMSFEQYFLRARVSRVFETIAQFFLAMVIFHDAILFIFKRFMSSSILFPWKKMPIRWILEIVEKREVQLSRLFCVWKF